MIGAISATGPTERLPTNRLPILAEMVVATARSISEALTTRTG